MAIPPVAPRAVLDQVHVLAQPRPMRRGSLSERYMKCGKAGCPCADDPMARHGPYFSLTRGTHGRTQSRLLPAAQAQMVRDQIAAGQAFRQDVEAYWQACEQWADAQLQPPEAASDGDAVKRKRGSKRTSQPKSVRNPTRS